MKRTTAGLASNEQAIANIRKTLIQSATRATAVTLFRCTLKKITADRTLEPITSIALAHRWFISRLVLAPAAAVVSAGRPTVRAVWISWAVAVVSAGTVRAWVSCVREPSVFRYGVCEDNSKRRVKATVEKC